MQLTGQAANAAPAWRMLTQLAYQFPAVRGEPGFFKQDGLFDLRAALVEDPTRVQRFSTTLTDDQGLLVHADFSKAHLDDAVMHALMELAKQQQLPGWRTAMFQGEKINATENRQVMHWMLRCLNVVQVPSHLQEEWREMDAVRSAFLQFAEAVRARDDITDIVNIGIGGSDLGPRMAVRALSGYTLPGKRLHFVSNVDGHEMHDVLQQVRSPQTTLFIVSSKSFTTLETMMNAHTALAWFKAQCGEAQVAQHFVGITTNVDAAAALGIHTTFGFKDWVGGRYSMWSPIGLPLAIAIGADNFLAFLQGAHAVDQHFLHTDLAHNLPVQLGLLDVWCSSFLGYTSRSVAPYHSRLQMLPAYLQQLEMESNGKRSAKDGSLLSYPTSGSIWGEPGSNGQHAFFQLLHQGPVPTQVEFIAVKQAQHHWQDHHDNLLANALAQAEGLMVGRFDNDPLRECPGNRPSTFMLLEALTPRTLGALIALYEHRVFVAGVVWGINSFDQFGVELGKKLALDILPRLQSGDTTGLDASTADLLRRLR